MIQFYPGGGPTRAGMESFGFPPHFHQTLHEFPLCKVNALLAGNLEAEGSPDAAVDPQEQAPDGAEGDGEASKETQEMEVREGDAEDDDSKEKERQERRREKKVK